MINLVKISDLDVNNKRVLVRLDLDIKEFNENDLRLTAATKTLDYLKVKPQRLL